MTLEPNGAAIEHDAAVDATTTEDDGWRWMAVEVFGRRRHFGRCREEETLGVKMLRIDVPTLVKDPPVEGQPANWSITGWTTIKYAPGAIYSLSETDEATVLKACRPYDSAYRYLPRPDRDDEGGGYDEKEF